MLQTIIGNALLAIVAGLIFGLACDIFNRIGR